MKAKHAVVRMPNLNVLVLQNQEGVDPTVFGRVTMPLRVLLKMGVPLLRTNVS